MTHSDNLDTCFAWFSHRVSCMFLSAVTACRDQRLTCTPSFGHKQWCWSGWRKLLIAPALKTSGDCLSAFFTSVFTDKTGLQNPRPNTRGIVWSKQSLPLVREHVNKLDIHKPMMPYGLHPQALRELAGVTERSLLIICGRIVWLSRWRESSECCLLQLY